MITEEQLNELLLKKARVYRESLGLAKSALSGPDATTRLDQSY
jgi:hypothetical protein